MELFFGFYGGHLYTILFFVEGVMFVRDDGRWSFSTSRCGKVIVSMEVV